LLPGLVGKFMMENGNTSLIDTTEHSSGSRSFKLESRWGWPVAVAKSFDLPYIAPYDLSDGSFRIEAVGEPWDSLKKTERITGVEKDKNQTQTKPKEKKSPEEPEGGDPYYIYSFDGKLMAEYDDSGSCLSDFIYMRNRLVAEYRPQESVYYYYTSDQINSTRMITDDTGTVVHSTTFDPFGGIEKAWVSTYDPALKFSGKERELANEMDYFGARYYAHTRYRWISPDPMINKDGAIANSQLWNLYAYSKNNPVTYFDPNGEDAIAAIFQASFDIISIYSNERTRGWVSLWWDLWTDERVGKGRTEYELGSWLYDKGGDPSHRWWRSSKERECSPLTIPDKSVLEGSVHTHTEKTGRYATRDQDTDVANKYHPGKEMFIISRYGVYSYLKGRKDKQILSYSQFDKLAIAFKPVEDKK